jgi:RND family efflux transporter MFP subunit
MKRFILITAALAGASCSSDEPGRLPSSEEPVAVTVSQAGRAPVVESFPAQVVSRRTAEVATRTSGSVERVLVDVGSAVREGQEMVLLDATDIEARVRAARAAETLARRAHGRLAALQADGAASDQELDQAVARLEAAAAGLAEVRAQEGYAVVRAPFDGVVTRRDVDPGDLAVPGRPLLTVVQPQSLEVRADLPAASAAHLVPGTPVTVLGDGDGVVVSASVSRIVPALDAGSRRVRVEITLPGGTELLPGAYVRIELTAPGEGPRWIPADAVVRRGQLTGVYAVEDGYLRLRWLRLGDRRGDGVELLAGPAGELAVVRRPTATLADGLPVSEVNAEEWLPSTSPLREVAR